MTHPKDIFNLQLTREELDMVKEVFFDYFSHPKFEKSTRAEFKILNKIRHRLLAIKDGDRPL